MVISQTVYSMSELERFISNYNKNDLPRIIPFITFYTLEQKKLVLAISHTQNEIRSKFCNNITNHIIKTEYKKQQDPLQITKLIRDIKIFTKNNAHLIIIVEKSNKSPLQPEN